MTDITPTGKAEAKALERMRKRVSEMYSKYRKPSRDLDEDIEIKDITVEVMDIFRILTAHQCEDLGEYFIGETNEWYGELEEPEPAEIDLFCKERCVVNFVFYPNQIRVNNADEEVKGSKARFGISETRSVRSRRSSKTTKIGNFGQRSNTLKSKIKFDPQPQPIEWDPHKFDDNSFTEEREKLRK